MKHTHEIDGKLHDRCEMCEEIRARSRSAKHDDTALKALAAHQARAERTSQET